MAVSHSILPSVLFYLLPSSSLSTSSSTYSTTTSPPLRNTSLYPACMEDTDCENDRRCFQYMCYPWQTSTGFRWCSKREDCAALLPEEGGDHRDGSCFKHEDSANINFGICLPRSQMIRCKSHRDCPGGKAPLGRKGSLRCTNGWCGDPKYFEALKQRPCKKDQECERLQTGEMCCYDFSSPQGWQLNSRIRELSLVYMDMVVCEALTYQMMLQLESCTEYRTTTTTTLSPRSGHHTSSSASWSPLLPLLFLAFLSPQISRLIS